MIDRLASFFAARNLDAYLVGGVVRDRLLSRSSEERDIDIAVAGDAVAVAQELAVELGGSLAPLSVPRGMMRVVLANRGGDEHGAGLTIDLIGFSEGIERDLARRDFSVNAMAVSLFALQQAQDDNDASFDSAPFGDRVIDPYGGRADLMRKTLRALSPDVFRDDPGRLLRAVRLAGELGLRMEPDTVRQLVADAHLLPRVAPDRVREEFLRILAPDGARGRIQTLDWLGLLEHIVPELMASKGVEQPRMHYWDVWGHSLHTVEAAEGVTGGHQNSPVFSCVPWTPESEAYFAETVSDGHTRRTVLKLAALVPRHRQASDQDAGAGRAHPLLRALGAGRGDGRRTAAAVAPQLPRRVHGVASMVEHHLRPTPGCPPHQTETRANGPPDRAILPLLPGRWRRGAGYALLVLG